MKSFLYELAAATIEAIALMLFSFTVLVVAAIWIGVLQ